MTYEVETVDVEGPLGTQTCDVVRMPRARFMEIVDEAMRWTALPDEDREALREVAREMPRFPLSTWMHPVRGCGCVVGEYAVRRDAVGRSELAHSHLQDDIVMDAMGHKIADFGYAIDSALMSEVGGGPETILIEDTEEGG